MTNKNPYENGVDIPDFVENKDDSIDMSVFKMADEEAKNSEPDFDDEEEYDDEPRRKLSSKGIVIIGGVLIVLLLIAAISGWIFGISKSNSLNKLQADYEAVQVELNKAKEDVTTLSAQNVELNAKIAGMEVKEEDTPASDEEVKGDKYKFAGDINVRDGVGSSKFANYKDLPTTVQDVLYYNEDLKTLTTRDGAIIVVSETKADSAGNTWGKVAKNAWICLKYNGEEWATKQ